jgi:SNF2 family DNA or RNA helicase
MSEITLFDHQRQGVEIAREYPRYAFFWQPGTGKTIAILAIQKERPMRTLVVAAKSIIWSAWEKDAKLLDVDLRVVHHTNKAKRRELILDKGNHILVTNYEQFRMNAELFIESGIQRIVFDESSKLKNRKAKVTQAAIQVADSCNEVYLLSGTPSPNCETELWSQLRVVSPVASGLQFYKWAYNWFMPITENIRGRNVIARWIPKKDMISQFHAYLKRWSWALRKEDCLDLPIQMDVVRVFELAKPEQKIYNQVIEELRLCCKSNDGDYDTTVSVRSEAVLMKLRQVAGGTVKVNDTPTEVGSSKLDTLVDVLAEIGSEPAIIWAEFTADIDRIARRLTKEGNKVGIIDGRTSKHAQEYINKFVSGELDRLVLHPKAAGHGTDGLQKVCQYAIYYGLSFSAEEHMQSRDRLHRSGQKRPVTYIYLIAKDSVDESLLWVVRKKSTKQQTLLKELGIQETARQE